MSSWDTAGLRPILELWVHRGREPISEAGVLWDCNGSGLPAPGCYPIPAPPLFLEAENGDLKKGEIRTKEGRGVDGSWTASLERRQHSLPSLLQTLATLSSPSPSRKVLGKKVY